MPLFCPWNFIGEHYHPMRSLVMESKLSVLEAFTKAANGIYVQTDNSKYLYHNSCDYNCLLFTCIYGDYSNKDFWLLCSNLDFRQLCDRNHYVTPYASIF